MHPLTRGETTVLGALLAARALSVWGPPVAQYAHYHDFADQRTWMPAKYFQPPMAAWPVLGVMHNVAQKKNRGALAQTVSIAR